MPHPEFTSAELSVLADDMFFDLKNRTDTKIKEVFSQLKQNLAEVSDQHSHLLPAGALQSLGKLQRGENYEGRPWRTMDFPAVLSGNDLFMFRTVLIWGRHISFNLILQGQFYVPEVAQSLLTHCQNIPNLKIWNHSDLWKWETDAPFCTPISAQPQLPDLPFFRILLPLPLDRVAEIPAVGTHFWKEIVGGLALIPPQS